MTLGWAHLTLNVGSSPLTECHFVDRVARFILCKIWYTSFITEFSNDIWYQLQETEKKNHVLLKKQNYGIDGVLVHIQYIPHTAYVTRLNFAEINPPEATLF